MGSLDPTPFHVLDDTCPDDTSLPAFMVSTTRGFLPRMNPVVELPAEFDALELILQRMPVKTAEGHAGLLAKGTLGETVQQELPDLTEAMAGYAHDLPLMNALYRDYSFLASAYLLEPCHERFVRGEEYGLGRGTLPRQIARPIARCAEICGFKPFMEYAGSYALYNYRLEDPKAGFSYDNLRLIRAFEYGLDPSSSEAGFVLVHIDMVKESGPLIDGTMKALSAASDSLAPSARESLNEGLDQILTAMRKVNVVMESMWTKSRPEKYTSFRTFIFGITSQSMFPDGVVYEGVFNDEPQSFRGESGANDSMVPLMDNLLQLPMPETPLTETLRDFRAYRPSNHRSFLQHVREQSLEVGLKGFALTGSEDEDEDEDENGVRQSQWLWLQMLDQVRDFRWRHWCFAREYILKHTSHPTATGGSPIVTWLPNQLGAVLEEMTNVYEACGGLAMGKAAGELMEDAMRQRDTLEKQVDRYCRERGVTRG